MWLAGLFSHIYESFIEFIFVIILAIITPFLLEEDLRS